MYMRKLTQQVITGHEKAVVETVAGKVRGALVEGTYIFRGIKYAEADRFHAPRQVSPWTGVKSALAYGYSAPELNTPLAHDAAYVPHYWYPQNENCQYLNIWTPSLDRNSKKPVMVWMHGGGWFGGSSTELFAYDGEELSKFGDVVVVSMNHRLGPLGFFDLSDYGEEYRDSDNAGLLDLIASLEWIRDNIEGFGGDSNNVTIMGQSGGGEKVVSMLQSPGADNLYHRLIMQSGGASVRVNESGSEKQIAELTLRNLGFDKSNIKEIESIPFYDFAAAVANSLYTWRELNGGARYHWGPMADQETYYGHPLVHGFRNGSNNIPILAGTTFGEFSGNADVYFAEGSKNEWSDEKVRNLYAQQFGDLAETVRAEFQMAYPEKGMVDVLFMDRQMRSDVLQFVRARATAASAPVYNWIFTLESAWNGGTVAFHNAEEPYMFHNAKYIESAYIPEVSERLQDQMAGAWVAFARSGNPNHSGLPLWEPVEKFLVPTMIFDRECRLAVEHDRRLLSVLPAKTTGKIFSGSNRMHAIYGEIY